MVRRTDEKNVVHVYGTIGKAPETSVALLQNPHHQQIMDQYLKYVLCLFNLDGPFSNADAPQRIILLLHRR